MFDTYCLPTLPAEWQPSNGPDVDRFTDAKELVRFIQKVEHEFELPKGVLFRKSQKSGRVKKRFKEVNLSEVRRSAAFYVLENTSLSLCFIASAMGFRDHSIMIHHREAARRLMSVKDKTFLMYYNRISSLN